MRSNLMALACDEVELYRFLEVAIIGFKQGRILLTREVPLAALFNSSH